MKMRMNLKDLNSLKLIVKRLIKLNLDQINPNVLLHIWMSKLNNISKNNKIMVNQFASNQNISTNQQKLLIVQPPEKLNSPRQPLKGKKHRCNLRLNLERREHP